MLGERPAVVLEVTPWNVHGVGHVDVTVVYPDRRIDSARLGRESVPEDLQVGDHVVVDLAMNTIIAVRRARAPNGDAASEPG
jgi:hypothetical protein